MNTGKAPLPPGSDADPHVGAVIVTDVEVHVDPVTLDRLFVVHSEAHGPITLRVAALAMPAILQKLAEAVNKAMN